jgi:hypothetical protein
MIVEVRWILVLSVYNKPFPVSLQCGPTSIARHSLVVMRLITYEPSHCKRLSATGSLYILYKNENRSQKKLEVHSIVHGGTKRDSGHFSYDALTN